MSVKNEDDIVFDKRVASFGSELFDGRQYICRIDREKAQKGKNKDKKREDG
ncbi:hypothetical protein J6TS1_13700 [Siminovitchia terrae]|uniref:Uncharacterized protein n=1 Tax=Siminovitchia terrae TaxID=1914933 RepID=A0ABQ4KTY0_SIMTE|nr:hypothetical protein J22TS1_18180 [Siminovitchia terrae]GIN95500.1 hypothetical protein J6TS1_13700 [Siminovitchia terrae]